MPTTDLRSDVMQALAADTTEEQLVSIILRYKLLGLGQKATYDTLESLWRELGEATNEDSRQRERLEEVMDRVWGYCPRVKEIWDTNLSDREAPDAVLPEDPGRP